MAIMSIGSTFVNWDNIITMNMQTNDEGTILTFESEHAVKDVLVPDATPEQIAAAIRHGIRKTDAFDLLQFIQIVKAYRGEANDD